MLLADTLPISVRQGGSLGDTACVLSGEPWPWRSIGDHAELS